MLVAVLLSSSCQDNLKNQNANVQNSILYAPAVIVIYIAVQNPILYAQAIIVIYIAVLL
jgi:hypothetical protein